MSGGLHCATRRLDLEVDLLDVVGPAGLLMARGEAGLAGRGVATTVDLSGQDAATAAKSVQSALDAIDTDDEVRRPGTGPVVMGGLRFAPGDAGSLVVPSLVVGRDTGGERWVTHVGTAAEVEAALRADPGTLLAPTSVPPQPARFAVEPERDPADWCRSVEAARQEIRAGRARKVVLARAVRVEADIPFSRRVVLGRLRDAYPGCHLYSTPSLVGASPELLVARTGEIVRSHPMAGTAARSTDPTADMRLAAGLLASTKDREEHRLTIDMVHDTLLPWCSWLDEEAEPSVVAVANVQHLATLVEGRLSSPPASVVELLVALHPTPAVGGSPRDEALAMIAEHEVLDRAGYAGPVGWADSRGNGTWAVGIRCAELTGPTARAFAGVGVVAGSDPSAELAETRAKLRAILSALVSP